jgi:hypothetical protein
VSHGAQPCILIEVRSRVAMCSVAPSLSSLSGLGSETTRGWQCSVCLPVEAGSGVTRWPLLTLLELGPRATRRPQPTRPCLEKSTTTMVFTTSQLKHCTRMRGKAFTPKISISQQLLSCSIRRRGTVSHRVPKCCCPHYCLVGATLKR